MTAHGTQNHRQVRRAAAGFNQSPEPTPIAAFGKSPEPTRTSAFSSPKAVGIYHVAVPAWPLLTVALMYRVTSIILCAWLLGTTTGCVIARRVSFASEEKFRVQSSAPERYAFRVAARSGTNDFAVGSDGRVTVTIPDMGPGCTSYLFGVRAFVVYDESPYTWRVIQVLHGDAVVCRFSLKQLARLHVDTDGHRVIRLE